MAQRSEVTAQTFVFADLSGFTALTEAHGDEQAADLAGGFCAAVRELLAEYQAREVKAIGDALMLRAGDAAAAIQLGLHIVHDVGAQHGFPLVRVGMHTGPAVERAGDWFGATVNLAARVSAAAAGGEVLVTTSTREAAGNVAGVRATSRACRSIRCAAWRSTAGTVRVGSPTRAWSTASARSAALARSRRIQARTWPSVPHWSQPLTDRIHDGWATPRLGAGWGP